MRKKGKLLYRRVPNNKEMTELMHQWLLKLAEENFHDKLEIYIILDYPTINYLLITKREVVILQKRNLRG